MKIQDARRTRGGPGTPDLGPPTPDALTSLADVVDRLDRDFAPPLTPGLVVYTVRHCRRELDIIHGDSLPELVERLARQRLQAIAHARAERVGEP